MNKAYKIVWSDCRKQHVITDEKHKGRGKGSVRTHALLSASIIPAVLFAFPLTALSQAISHSIQVDPAWNGTRIETSASGLHQKITTSHILGSVAANKFTEFKVGDAHLVDMHLPDQTNHLVNFVDSAIQVGGTVNAIKGSQIGGNIHFVSPQGMLIGQNGVINAGGLTASITSDAAYKELSRLSDSGSPIGLGKTAGEALETVERLQNGEVPLNPAGVITVKGKISTANRITLAASSVTLESGAALSNTLTDFGDLVNVRSPDGVITQSDAADTVVMREASDGSGDILLIGRSDSSEINASSDTGKRVLVSAKVEVQEGASINSRDSIEISALAGNGTYDVQHTLLSPEFDRLSEEEKSAQVEEKGQFLSEGRVKNLEVSSSAEIAGALHAEKDVRIASAAENRFASGEEGALEATTLPTLNIMGTVTPFNEAVYHADLKTSSNVNVAPSAEISAQESLAIKSNANTRLEIGIKTSFISLFNSDQTQVVPSIAAVAVAADSSSRVNLEGKLNAGSDLILSSGDNLKTSAAAASATKLSDATKTSFLSVDLKGVSEVNLSENAVVGVDSGRTNVSISSVQQSSVNTDSKVKFSNGSYGGLAFNYTSLDTDSTVNVGTGFAQAAKDINISSENITSELTVSAENEEDFFNFNKLIAEGIAGVSRAFVSGLMGKVSSGVDPSLNSAAFKIGGGVGVVAGSQSASLEINSPVIEGKSVGLISTGNFAANAEAQLRDHHYEVTSKVSSKTTSSTSNPTAAQGSVAVLVVLPDSEEGTLKANLDVKDDSVLKAENGSLSIAAVAEAQWNRLQKMKEDLASSRQQLRDLFEKDYPAQWAKIDAAFASLDSDFSRAQNSGLSAVESIQTLSKSLTALGTALDTFIGGIRNLSSGTSAELKNLLAFLKPTNYLNAVAASAGGASDSATWSAAGTAVVLNQKTSSSVSIGKNTQISAMKQGSTSAGAGSLQITSQGINESLALGGNTDIVFGIPVPSLQEASAVGATVLYNQLVSDSSVIVRENAKLSADGAAEISSDDRIFALSLGASSDVNKGNLSMDGLAVVTVTKGSNLVWLDDESNVEASSISIEAARDDDIETVAGALVISSSNDANKSAGAAIAVNTGTLGNEIRVSDNDVLTDGDSSRFDTKGGLQALAPTSKVEITAHEDLTMNAVGSAGTAAVSGQKGSSQVNGFFDGISGIFSDFENGVGYYLKEGGSFLASKMNLLGASIRGGFDANQSQNDPTSSSMTSGGSSLAQDGSYATTTDRFTSGVSKGGTNQFQIGAAGSAAWNDTGFSNAVNIQVSDFVIEANKEITIDALTDKWIGAWAGAAGLNYASGSSSSGYSVGIAGALAANAGDYLTKVNIDGSLGGTKGLRINSTLNTLNIRSISNGVLVAEGLSAEVTKGSGSGAASFDAGVSYNAFNNSVSSSVKGVTQTGLINSYNQISRAGDTQVTGGTGFSFGHGGSSGTASFGGSLVFAYAKFDNTISSSLSNSDFRLRDKANILSLADMSQITTAVSSSISAGERSFGLSGAAASTELNNDVSVSLSDLDIEMTSANADFAAQARSSTGSEAAALDDLTSNHTHSANLDELSNISYAKDVELKLSFSDGASEDSVKIGDLSEKSGTMKQIVVAVSPEIAQGSSAGAAVVNNQINNRFSVDSEDSAFQFRSPSSSFSLGSRNDVFSLGVAAGGAGGNGAFNAAGSVVVSNISQSSLLSAEDLSVTANQVNAAAENAALNINVAGNVGVNVGGNSIGAAGASVVVANTTNSAKVQTQGLVHESVNFANSADKLSASNTAESWAASADGNVSVSGLTMSGAVAVNRVKNDSLVQSSDSSLTNVKDITAQALDRSAIRTLAGNIAVSSSGLAGLSAASAYTSSRSSETNVSLDNIDVISGTFGRSTLTADAQAQDNILSVAVGGGFSGSAAALSGVSTVNEITRTVHSSINNLHTLVPNTLQNGRSLSALNISSTNRGTIDNYGIVIDVSAQAGAGLASAVNRINSSAETVLASDDNSGRIYTNTLSVTSVSSNRINTVGVGGFGGEFVGAGGNAAVNLVTNNAIADIKNIDAEYSGAAVLQARSDDTIGTYAGQLEGAQGAAVGATIAVSEKHGSTKASILNSKILRSAQQTNETLKVKGTVDSNDINSKIVNSVSKAASLEDRRQDRTVSGLLAEASSTETFKTFFITGAGAISGSVQGSGNVNSLGGQTLVEVTNSELSSGRSALNLTSSDAVNYDVVMATAAGAQGAAISQISNILTTNHKTDTIVRGQEGKETMLSGASVSVNADAKEGISSLSLTGSGAQYAALGAIVNVNRQLSDVNANVSGAKVNGAYSQNAVYLGRITTSSAALAGAQGAAIPVSVVINYADNTVNASAVDSSILSPSSAASIHAGRTTEISSINSVGAGAEFGAAAAIINVNTVEGATQARLSRTDIEAGTFSLTSENEDHLDITDVSVSGAAGSLGASVVVNYFQDSAKTEMSGSSVKAQKANIYAQQDRYVDAVLALVSLGAGTLDANVFSVVIGSSTNPLTDTLEDLGEESKTLQKYMSLYSGTGTNGDSFIQQTGVLSSAEQKQIVSEAASESAAPSNLSEQGTVISVSDSNISANTVEIAAKEDTKSGAGVDVTVGSGSLAAGAAAASVTTLRRRVNSTVSVTNSDIDYRDTLRISNLLGGSTELEVIQTALSLAGGTSAYADADISGTSQTKVSGGRISSDKGSALIQTENNSATKLKSLGVEVAFGSGGGMVADLRDKSSVSTEVSNEVISSNLETSTRRAQTLNAEATAGHGGAANGVGALASVTDGRTGSLSANTVFSGNTVGANNISLITNNRPNISVKGYSAGAGGFGIGVVKAVAESRGTTGSSIVNNQFTDSSLTVLTGAGLSAGVNNPDDEALKMTANSQTYGGAVFGSIPVNSSRVINTNLVSSTINLNKESSLKDFVTKTSANAVYVSKTTAGTGGLLAVGDNYAEVRHGAQVSSQVISSDAVKFANADVSVLNTETAQIKADSAGGGAVLSEGTSHKSNAAEADHWDTSNSTLTIFGIWHALGDASFSVLGRHDVALKADNTKGALGGGSGVGVINSLLGTNLLKVSDYAQIDAKGLKLRASDDWKVSSADGAYAADSRVYGGLVGTGISIDNTERRTQRVDVGKAVLTAEDLTVSAYSSGDTVLKARAISGAAVAGVTANNNNTIDTQNVINIASGASLEALNKEGTLTIAASSDENIEAQSVGSVEGAAIAGAGAKVKVDQNRTNKVTVGSGASVLSHGRIALRAGRDEQGQNSQFNLVSYSHAYSHSLIGGTDSSVSDSLNLSDVLNLNGSIVSWRDVELYAQSGDVSTEETARYWFWTSASDAGNVAIASTGAGTKSKNLSTNNKINVSGLVQAGVNTRADVDISGLVYQPEAGVVVYGSVANKPAVTVSGVDNYSVSYGTESLANKYWTRHLELQEAMKDYSNSSPSLLAAYQAEDDYLIGLMKQQGLVETDGSGRVVSLVQSAQKPYVLISNLTVSGGNISAYTDQISGNGSIVAKAAEGININNRSTASLKVSDIYILDKGGRFKLNDQIVTEANQIEGYQGRLENSANSSDPAIKIQSKYAGNLVVNTNRGRITITPDTGVEIYNDLVNLAGNISVISGNDIYAASSARISAAGSLGMTAQGAITQSYHEGLFNTGGSVEALWTDQSSKLSINNRVVVSNDNRVYAPGGEGDIVAGGGIFLAADAVNLNGYIQSGYDSYQLDLTGSAVEQKIAKIKANWKASGSPSDVNVRSAEYALQDGGAVWSDGVYKYQVSAWYDPVRDVVVIDDINPQGGQIFISGRLASTGGGKLVAADGAADISVDVKNHDILLGNIDTGNVQGLIQLSDTSYGYSNRPADAVSKVTEIRRSGSTSYWLDANGNKSGIVSTTSTIFSPISGQLYGWTDGVSSQTVTNYYKTQNFTLWNLIDYNPKSWDYSNTVVVRNDKLASGSTIWTSGRDQGGNSNFAAWATTLDKQTTSKTESWTKYNNFLKFNGQHYTHKTETTNTSTLFSYTVRADHDVGTSFIGGANSIRVSGGKSILLDGVLNAEGGLVSISAQDDIRNNSSSAAITGAKDLMLAAKNGSIGTDVSNIRWSAASGDLKLNASAGGSIYLDASHLQQGASVQGSMSAGNTIKAEFRGDVNLGKVLGQRISITSNDGGIKIDNLIQTEAEDMTQRLDLHAQKDINLATSSDVYVGRIETTGDVEINAKGAILDAVNRSDDDERSSERRLESWKEAGLLDAWGASSAETRYQEDIKNVEDGIASDFNRYQSYLDFFETKKNSSDITRELSADETKDFAQLEDRFKGCATSEQAIARERQLEGSLLYQVIASRDKYGWTKEQLMFAVSEALLNDDPSYVPDSGAANIKGSNIRLTSSKGSIGNELQETTSKISDLNSGTESGFELYKLLARAEPGDVSWDWSSDTVKISLKRPMIVESLSPDGSLYASAAGDIYLESIGNRVLNIHNVHSENGDVRLTAVNGLNRVGEGKISGADVLLRGGEGSLGSMDNPLYLEISGSGVFSSNNGVYLDQNGTLNVRTLSSGGDVYIKADNIYSASGDSLSNGHLFGSSFIFEVAGNLGSKDSLLNLASDKDFSVIVLGTPLSISLSSSSPVQMTLEGEDGGELLVSSDITAESAGSLRAERLTSETGNIGLRANLDMHLGSVHANRDIQAQAENISISSDLVSDEGDISLVAGKDLSLMSNSRLTAKSGKIVVDAVSHLYGTGVVLEADGISVISVNELKGVDVSLISGLGGSGISVRNGGVEFDGGVLDSDGVIGITSDRDIRMFGTLIRTPSTLSFGSLYGSISVSAADSSEAGQIHSFAGSNRIVIDGIKEGQKIEESDKGIELAPELSGIESKAENSVITKAEDSVDLAGGEGNTLYDLPAIGDSGDQVGSPELTEGEGGSVYVTDSLESAKTAAAEELLKDSEGDYMEQASVRVTPEASLDSARPEHSESTLTAEVSPSDSSRVEENSFVSEAAELPTATDDRVQAVIAGNQETSPVNSDSEQKNQTSSFAVVEIEFNSDKEVSFAADVPELTRPALSLAFTSDSESEEETRASDTAAAVGGTESAEIPAPTQEVFELSAEYRSEEAANMAVPEKVLPFDVSLNLEQTLSGSKSFLAASSLSSDSMAYITKTSKEED